MLVVDYVHVYPTLKIKIIINYYMQQYYTCIMYKVCYVVTIVASLLVHEYDVEYICVRVLQS